MSDTPPVAPDIEAIIKQALEGIKLPTTLGVTTDVGAVANCITEALKFAQTAQGQLFIADWRTAGAKANTWFEGAGKSITSWLDGLKGLFK